MILTLKTTAATAKGYLKLEPVSKSTKDFDIFGAEPWHRQDEHRKFKSRSD
jgi:hypothetical protein